MDRGIKVVRRMSEYSGTTQGIRIRVEVSEVTNMPSKIFRYLLGDVNPNTGAKAGQFEGVCSPTDIAEMPEDAPILTEDPAWFRLDYVDLLLESREIAMEFWEDLHEDICGLVTTYKLMDNMTDIEEFTCGTVIPDTPSSSSSSLAAAPSSSSSAVPTSSSSSLSSSSSSAGI